jgi:hypothetical protein
LQLPRRRSKIADSIAVPEAARHNGNDNCW